MAVGDYLIRLDPQAFYLTERGFQWQVRCNHLYDQFLSKDNAGNVVDCGFINPPGSEWVMTRPVQWSPDWAEDIELAGYTLRRPDWVWPTEFTFTGSAATVNEYFPLNKPGEAEYNDYAWLQAQVPAAFTPVAAKDFNALAVVCAVDLPAGTEVIAAAWRTPEDPTDGLRHQLWAFDSTPHLQVGLFPNPKDSKFVCGFHDIGLVISQDSVLVARELANGSWDLLQKIATGKSFYSEQVMKVGRESLISSAYHRLTMCRIAAIPVLPDWLYLYLGNEPHAIRLRVTETGTANQALFARSNFWVAGAPDQRLLWHAEVTGYVGGHWPPETIVGGGGGGGSPDWPRIMFNLGLGYAPTIEPTLGGQYAMNGTPTTAVVVSDVGGGGKDMLAPNGQHVQVKLIAGDGTDWVSDGTNIRGALHVILAPSDSTYQGTQLRVVDVKFDEKQAVRAANEQTLTDDEYAGFRAETSYRDPEGKRASVTAWMAGSDALDAQSYGRRKYYPLHIEETTAGPAQTARVKMWVHEVEKTDHRTETATAPAGYVRAYTFRGKGFLSRGEGDWGFLPQLVNPSGGGYITHTFAVEQSVRQMGIDVADSEEWAAHTDPLLNTNVGWLPGTWANYNPATGTQGEGCVWAPDWDEGPLRYATRIAQQWRGWVLYEDLAGKVWYHPDIVFASRVGQSYYISCTLYRTAGEAVSLGYPGMYYEVLPQREVETQEANEILLMGPDGADDTPIPQIRDRLNASITDIASRDFMGEPKTKTIVSKMAVTPAAKHYLARVARYQYCYTPEILKVAVPTLAPWDFTPAPVDVGRCITLSSKGDFCIIHCEVEQLRANPTLHRTVLTCERMPAGAAASGSAGAYPGAGV